MARSKVVSFGPVVEYLAIFAASYGILVAFLASMPAVSNLFTSLVTHIAAVLLSSMGFVADVWPQTANAAYAEIRFNSTVYRVNEDCTGLSLVMLVAASVVAIPAPLRIRTVGLVLMGLLAAAIGCMRIVILGCVAEYQAHIFHFFHTYLMEVATVGFGLWILLSWFNFTIPHRRSAAV